jgi:hypothetical protein
MTASALQPPKADGQLSAKLGHSREFEDVEMPPEAETRGL